MMERMRDEKRGVDLFDQKDGVVLEINSVNVVPSSRRRHFLNTAQPTA